ncbi:39S mitochondrial ribosomal protein L46-domain-containing protein [Sparassis latifolia]
MFRQNALSACRRSTRACISAHARSLATLTDTPNPSTSFPPPKPPQPAQKAIPVINAAVILNRSPILTRTLTVFEQTYYDYQSRIQRALFNPFADEFYFKPGALLEGKFDAEEKAREREAFGRVRPGGSTESRDDSATPDAAAIPPEETADSTPAPEQKPMPRIHEADKTGDVRSLDRQGERNLYLLLQAKADSGAAVWRFPQGDVEKDEVLHTAAERDLRAECGTQMDTWVVSRKPVGVYEPSTPNGAKSDQTYVFFYKAHILAGQVQPDGKKILDFAWLTKEEIEPRVDAQYWSGVKDMLSDF